MDIAESVDGSTLTLQLDGRLDAANAPKLETAINAKVNGITKLILDFTKVEYVSSAGLRIIVAAQKHMQKQGGMVVRNVNSAVMEVFEMTRFVNILTIE